MLEMLRHSESVKPVSVLCVQLYINDLDRQTLSLSFKDQQGDLITDHRPYKIKLLPFFSNLLPEGHLRKYLAERAGIEIMG